MYICSDVCMVYNIVIVFLLHCRVNMYVLYAISFVLVTGVVTTDNVHYVLPNDKLCINLPCRELQYFIDNGHRYFISNSKFFFAEGTYYHIKTDLIVQNIANISFIGTALSNTSSPTSIIRCLPEHTIKFYNVQNLTISNIVFKSCGNDIAIPVEHSNIIIQPSEYQPKYWASIFFIACINITVNNVRIDDPVGYGITCANVMGKTILNNITIIMRSNGLYGLLLNTCSSGIYIMYSGRKQDVTAHVAIFGVVLIQTKIFNSIYCHGHKMIALSLKQERFGVHFTISHSVFHQLHGNIINIAIESLTNNSVHFNNCRFSHNNCTINSLSQPYTYGYLIDIHYKLTCFTGVSITISDCNFTDTNRNNKFVPSAILHFETAGKYKCYLPQYDNILICLSNVIFYNNAIALLQVLSTPAGFLNGSTIVTINVDNFSVLNNQHLNKLIRLHYATCWFRKKSVFMGNGYTDIIYSHSSQLMFSNYTLFYNNRDCDHLIRLDGDWQYITLKDNATIEFRENYVHDELVSVPETYNHPFRYCLFQFILYRYPQNNFQSFDISFSRNIERAVNTKRSNSSLNELSSHCKWINEPTPQNVDKSNLYNKIIACDHENKLGIHTTVCYSQHSSHYNCSMKELGPIYPGQILTVHLCLPYNYENTGLLYVETYNDHLPVTACKVVNQDDLKHKFKGNHTKSVYFTIASNSPTKCELFLTAQPDLYTNYDVFNVKLLPCPLGFAFQHGVCDCDPLLRSYTEECVILNQTVKRLSNHWITGNTSSNDTKYLVSKSCPIVYCSYDLMVNVHLPDMQCQQHRTGLLCSQCTPGYSLVLGTSRCKKCTDTHLILIVPIMLTGILLVAFLFVSNLTVTTGTINGIILFVNIVEMNSHLLGLQSRLVDPLFSYLIITNLGICFETCFFNGMDIYVKKWLQLAFPGYLAIIAALFIIASRYSSRLYRLTHNRSLPVLATLFMLTYTSALQIISSVFLYTTITSLPSKTQKIVWSLDPDIPLWKLLLLIIVCLLLFSFLLMLNIVLLFTKWLMRFKIINRFKPIIDAFQGPFKHHYYYWIGLQLLLRNIMFLLSALVKDLSINIGCIIIITIAIIHGFIQPYKSNMINVQEALLLYNYAIMCALISLKGSEFQNVIVVNIMVALSLVQFIIIIGYHIFTYVICTRLLNSCSIKWCRRYNQRTRGNVGNDIEMEGVGIDFREPLLGQD